MREYPIVMFKAQQVDGRTVYHPANSLAECLCNIAAQNPMSERAMNEVKHGFRVIETNGQPLPLSPLPHPRNAYRRREEVRPRHIYDKV